MASVVGREPVGGGQHLDVCGGEVVAALFVGAQKIGAYAQEGRLEKRGGTGMSLAAPASMLPCADGHHVPEDHPAEIVRKVAMLAVTSPPVADANITWLSS